MSKCCVLLAGLAVTSCCIIAVQAAPVALNLRRGLWEMTTSGETTGAPPIPADLLARMPPERRAKFEAAMAASHARSATPHAFKQCITPESLQRGLKVDDKNNDPTCKQTVVSSTGSVMDMRMECASSNRTSSGTFHFEAASREAVAGTINMTIGDGAHNMTIKRVIQGKWLSADCGNVKSTGN